MFASFDNHHNQNTSFLTLVHIYWLFWDNNGFDYNALKGINPKFLMSQTSDLSATKVQPKTFSMTQGRPVIQNPKISSTHNASSFKFALFKKPEALAIPDASRRSVFSFEARQRTQAESSSQNRLSALLSLSDVQEPLKAPVNIMQDHDIGQGRHKVSITTLSFVNIGLITTKEGRRDASSPLQASPYIQHRVNRRQIVVHTLLRTEK